MYSTLDVVRRPRSGGVRLLIAIAVAALVASVLQVTAPISATAATLVATVQAETLTRTGSTSANATVATFYSNNDSAYGTVAFAEAGRYTVTVNGSSTASNTAGISVLVAGSKVGALTFSGTSYTNASATFDVTTSGDKEVRLRLETDNGQNDTRIDYLELYYVGPTPPLPPAPVPPAQGAYATGDYRNLFTEWDANLTEAEIDVKIANYWTHFFTGTDDTKRLYYPSGSNANGPLAYILDTGNSDIRSEGVSYGMMIAVQLDKKTEFDAMWNWAKTYMQHKTGPRTGYFCWQATTAGTCSDANPASDGEEYFATALLFAGNRWGDGTGIYNYTAEGNAILNTMLHKEDMNGGVVGSVTNMFNATNKMIVFVPFASAANFSDPSYHLPAFYELWGRWATGYGANQAADRQFWLDAAQRSRQYFVQATHPTTGLNPDYAEFSGAPNNTGNHGDFRFDAWRTSVNWAVDYAWWAADPNQKVLTDRMQSFFEGQGMTSYVNQYSLAGNPLSTDRSPGLIASNGAASLSATDQRAWKFVEALWGLQPSTGQYRYYDGLLNFMALLHASGNFQIYGPGSGTPDTVAPTAPTGVTLTAATSTSVTLSWTASTDNRAVTGYTAHLGGSTAGAVGCVAVATTSCTLTGLSPSTDYSVTITASDLAGNVSVPSAAVDVQTLAVSASPPAAPSQLSAIANSATAIQLSWNDNSFNESGFVVERRVGTAGVWGTLTTKPANATGHSDTGLTTGTQYFYRVRATNGAGDSALTSVADARPLAAGVSGPNRNAAYKIEVESFDESSGDVTIEAGDGGTVVSFGATGNNWVKFSGVDFGTTNVANVNFRAQKPSNGDKVVLYIDNLSTARCTVYPDGNNNWHLKNNSCSPAFQGVHDVYLKPEKAMKLNFFYVAPHSSGADAPTLPASVANAIAAAHLVDVSLYTPSSAQTFAAALAAVKALTASTPAGTINSTVAALTAAQAALVPLADFTALRAALLAVEGLDSGDYTAESWNTLQLAVVAAWAVNSSSAQSAVDAATASVNSAIADLTAPVEVSDLSGLQAALASAAARDAADYTAGTWAVLQNAVAAGLVLTSASPQATVDAATADVLAAVAALVELSDLTSLRAALDTAAALNEAGYTAGSWATLQAAVAAGEALTGSTPQATIAAATSAVLVAIAGLVEVSDLSGLQAALASAAARDAADYTAGTWAVLQNAVAAGLVLTSASPQATVDAATADVLAAVAALVELSDLTSLRAALDTAAALNEAGYTAGSWATLQAAVAAGEALTGSTPQATIAAATSAVLVAIAGLVEVSDLSGLQAALASAAARDAADYTAGTWAVLQNAVAAGLVLTSASPQATVDAATADVLAAVAALVELSDLTSLRAALDTAAALNEAGYTAGSWATLQAAVAAGEALTGSTPQATIAAATSAVLVAIAGLVEVSDLSGLQAALASAAARDAADYTAGTWAVLQNAVAAGLVLTSASPQATVDAATADVLAAVAALVPVDTTGDGPTVHLGAAQVQAGGTLEFTLEGFEPGTVVDLVLSSAPEAFGGGGGRLATARTASSAVLPATLTTITIGPTGAGTATLTIPTTVTPGNYRVAAEVDGTVVASASLTVTAAAAAGIAATGLDISATLVLLLLLLAAGVALIARSRRQSFTG